jgi:hypothetical protein
MQISVKALIDKAPHLRLAGGSHDISPPRTTTLCLTRQLFASPPTTCLHEKCRGRP